MSAAAALRCLCPPDTGSATSPTSQSRLRMVSTDAGLVRLRSLQTCILLRGLLYEESLQVVNLARDCHFEAREIIASAGDPVRHIIVLTSGRMKVLHRSSDGQEVIVRILSPGAIATGLAVRSDGTEFYSVETMEPCTGIVWDSSTLGALLKSFPYLEHNLVAAAAAQLRDIEERYCELATAKVPVRLARTLRRLCDEMGRRNEDGSVIIRLSREELSQMVGTTIFAVSRLLSQWENDGVLTGMRQAVCIQNMSALEERVIA